MKSLREINSNLSINADPEEIQRPPLRSIGNLGRFEKLQKIEPRPSKIEAPTCKHKELFALLLDLLLIVCRCFLKVSQVVLECMRDWIAIFINFMYNKLNDQEIELNNFLDERSSSESPPIRRKNAKIYHFSLMLPLFIGALTYIFVWCLLIANNILLSKTPAKILNECKN